MEYRECLKRFNRRNTESNIVSIEPSRCCIACMLRFSPSLGRRLYSLTLEMALFLLLIYVSMHNPSIYFHFRILVMGVEVPRSCQHHVDFNLSAPLMRLPRWDGRSIDVKLTVQEVQSIRLDSARLSLHFRLTLEKLEEELEDAGCSQPQSDSVISILIDSDDLEILRHE